MEKILETKNVSKIYDLGEVKIHAIKNVSLEIYRGDFITIVGKSGSGKSTLMHLIGLLDTPTSGEVYLNGQSVGSFSEPKLAKIRNNDIGFVFQSFNLLPRTTALDNITLPLEYSTVPRSSWKAKAFEMLETVDLTDRAMNKSSELSGGQKQRVAIARALINDPSIIIADEPTGNLDTKTGDDIIDMFVKLNAAGRTIVIVTHDEDVARVAKRRITLRDGEIV